MDSKKLKMITGSLEEIEKICEKESRIFLNVAVNVEQAFNDLDDLILLFKTIGNKPITVKKLTNARKTLKSVVCALCDMDDCADKVSDMVMNTLEASGVEMDEDEIPDDDHDDDDDYDDDDDDDAICECNCKCNKHAKCDTDDEEYTINEFINNAAESMRKANDKGALSDCMFELYDKYAHNVFNVDTSEVGKMIKDLASYIKDEKESNDDNESNDEDDKKGIKDIEVKTPKASESSKDDNADNFKTFEDWLNWLSGITAKESKDDKKETHTCADELLHKISDNLKDDASKDAVSEAPVMPEEQPEVTKNWFTRHMKEELKKAGIDTDPCEAQSIVYHKYRGKIKGLSDLALFKQLQKYVNAYKDFKL